MKNFNQAIINFIREHSLLMENDRVLVACSGGVDSVALLHFLASNRKRFNIEVAAVHVDHMLRGVQSEEDGVLVSELCEKIGVPFYGGRVPIPEIMKTEGGNVQAICREERYIYFSDVMQQYKYNILATAHHAEDQLETVLMQVTNGNAPLGIPKKRKVDGGLLIRPLLPVEKGSLYSYAKETNLPFNEDPSNASDAYMRNRFRRHVIPHILDENPSAPKSVVFMANQLQEDETLLQKLAKERLEQIIEWTDSGLPTIYLKKFSDMPTALQRRMITLLLGYLYNEKDVSIQYKTALVKQLVHHLSSEKGNISINLPLGYRFLREYDRLTFILDDEKESLTSNRPKMVPMSERTKWMNDLWVYWTTIGRVTNDMYLDAKEIRYFDLPDDSLPLFVRSRQDGDRILLPGMTSSKRLSRLFIDEKVNQSMRDWLPIIVTNENEVCAVPGLRYGKSFTKNKTAASQYIFIFGKSSSKSLGDDPQVLT